MARCGSVYGLSESRIYVASISQYFFVGHVRIGIWCAKDSDRSFMHWDISDIFSFQYQVSALDF